MALLPTNTSTAHGAALSAPQAVTASDTFTNNAGRTLLEVTNGSGGSLTVTFVPGSTFTISSGVTYSYASDAQTVVAGAGKIFGPFNTAIFGSGTTVTVNFSATTSVTARVVEMGPA
jgi:hypothetical protein